MYKCTVLFFVVIVFDNRLHGDIQAALSPYNSILGYILLNWAGSTVELAH